MWRRSNIQPNKSLGWWRLTLILCVFDQLSNSVDRYINNFQIVDNLSDRGSLIIHLFKVKPCRRQSDLPVLHQGEFFSGCVMWLFPSWPAGFTQTTLLIQLLGTVSYTLAPSHWTILPPHPPLRCLTKCQRSWSSGFSRTLKSASSSRPQSPSTSITTQVGEHVQNIISQRWLPYRCLFRYVCVLESGCHTVSLLSVRVTDHRCSRTYTPSEDVEELTKICRDNVCRCAQGKVFLQHGTSRHVCWWFFKCMIHSLLMSRWLLCLQNRQWKLPQQGQRDVCLRDITPQYDSLPHTLPTSSHTQLNMYVLIQKEWPKPHKRTLQYVILIDHRQIS